MKNKNLAIVLIYTGIFSGCATVGTALLPNETLATQTSKVISESAKNITISNRSEESVYTYYTATTKDGKSYSCKITGGSVSTIALLGQSERPKCEKAAGKKH